MLVHLRRICDHLSSVATVEEGVQLVAINACYSGSPARLYVGRFHQDLLVSKIGTFGFDSEPGLLSTYESALLPQLISSSIQSNSIVIKEHDFDYQILHRSAVGVDDSPNWKSTILMPLLPSYFAALSLVVDVSEGEDKYEYFDTVRSILNLYLTLKLKSSKSQNSVRRDRPDSNRGAILTERQEIILDMVKAGQTNRAIADRLGYSESLIRLETITIYRKLGIEGRRDLQID